MARKLRSSFSRWLMTRAGEPGPVGDLARDVRDDYSWPDVDSIDQLRDYLSAEGAINEAMDTLELAWSEFERWRRV